MRRLWRSNPEAENQRGASTAEFAVVAAFFFMVILGIIEFGRLLYTHNALTDATRRGARYAVLHEPDVAQVQNAAVYGELATYDADGNPTSAPLVPGLRPEQIQVNYENPYGINLGRVTVSIKASDPYLFNFNIPGMNTTLTMPKYVTTLNAESAGTVPADR